MHGMVESERVSPFVNNMCCAKKSNTLKNTAMITGASAAATLGTDLYMSAKTLSNVGADGFFKNLGMLIKRKEIMIPLLKRSGIVAAVAGGLYLACKGISSLFSKQ